MSVKPLLQSVSCPRCKFARGLRSRSAVLFISVRSPSAGEPVSMEMETSFGLFSNSTSSFPLGVTLVSHRLRLPASERPSVETKFAAFRTVMEQIAEAPEVSRPWKEVSWQPKQVIRLTLCGSNLAPAKLVMGTFKPKDKPLLCAFRNQNPLRDKSFGQLESSNDVD